MIVGLLKCLVFFAYKEILIQHAIKGVKKSTAQKKYLQLHTPNLHLDYKVVNKDEGFLVTKGSVDEEDATTPILSNSQSIHYLSLNKKNACNPTNCLVKCGLCGPTSCCAHKYICTCPQYAFLTFCRHQHVLGRFLLSLSNPDHSKEDHTYAACRAPSNPRESQTFLKLSLKRKHENNYNSPNKKFKNMRNKPDILSFAEAMNILVFFQEIFKDKIDFENEFDSISSNFKQKKWGLLYTLSLITLKLYYQKLEWSSITEKNFIFAYNAMQNFWKCNLCNDNTKKSHLSGGFITCKNCELVICHKVCNKQTINWCCNSCSFNENFAINI